MAEGIKDRCHPTTDYVGLDFVPDHSSSCKSALHCIIDIADPKLKSRAHRTRFFRKERPSVGRSFFRGSGLSLRPTPEDFRSAFRRPLSRPRWCGRPIPLHKRRLHRSSQRLALAHAQQTENDDADILAHWLLTPSASPLQHTAKCVGLSIHLARRFRDFPDQQ